MKRQFVLWSGLAMVIVWQAVTSCSNPLEVQRPTAPEQFTALDSVFLMDTLTLCDTVYVSDSVVRVDTVLVTDSVLFMDTVLVMDTVVQIDTLVVTDTVVQQDTVRVVDTLLRVDTVVVTLPGPGECPGLCSQLNSYQKEIVWRLDNAAGTYHLEFSAVTERDQPAQNITVYAGGNSYHWSPATQSEFTIDLDLPADAQIKLCLDNPKACGHSVTVCLSVTAL
jgi:hypothetical protein